MRRCRLALVVVGAAAFAAPAGARAADHLSLDASTRLGGALAGWRLAVHADSGDVYATDDPATQSPLTRGGYVRVRLVRRAGAADERHDLIGLPTSDTIAFDGTAGTLDVRSELGSALAIRMAISTAGTATPTNALACTGGSFVSVPVRLRGTFVLATGTRLFGTLRPAALSGRLISNRGGHVAGCFDRPVAACTPGEELSASVVLGPGAARPAVVLGAVWAPRERYAYAAWISYLDGPADPEWKHQLFVDLPRRPFAGPPRHLRFRLPAHGPLRGSGLLRTTRVASTPAPECGSVETQASGSLEGTFGAVYHGWGRLKLPGRMNAEYDSQRPARLH
jgi:hypothetical protein